MSANPSPTLDAAETLVLHEAGAPNQWDDVKFQQLWLATQRRPWRSLAVVSASKGISTIETANVLAKISWWYSGAPSGVVDLRDLSMRLLEHQLSGLHHEQAQGGRIFMALRSTFENPTSVLAARAADAAILCVELGSTDAKSARHTLDAIGRERFIGTIILSGSKRGVAKADAGKRKK